MDREVALEMLKTAVSKIIWDREGCATVFDSDDEDSLNQVLDDYGFMD